jgi:hypothetical protein
VSDGSQGVEELCVFIAKLNPSHGVSLFPVLSLGVKQLGEMMFDQSSEGVLQSGEVPLVF